MIYIMRQLWLSLIVLHCVGCSDSAREFVQDDIHIAAPVKVQSRIATGDGGTVTVRLLDAKGRSFLVYVDYQIGSPTPGAIYLHAYRGERKSVRVLDEPHFKSIVGDLEVNK